MSSTTPVRPPFGRVLLHILLAIVITTPINIGIRYLGQATGLLTDHILNSMMDNAPLGVMNILISSIVSLLIGGVVWIILAMAIPRRAVLIWRIICVVILVVEIFPPFGLADLSVGGN